MTKGADLRAARAAAYITTVDLCRVIGVGRVTLHKWERMPEVRPDNVVRYRLALAQLVAEKEEAA